MDIKELKKLIKNGGSAVILENGEPSFVVLGYETYKNLDSGGEEKDIKINHANSMRHIKADTDDYHNSNFSEATRGNLETEILEKFNKGIAAIKSQIESEEKNLIQTEDWPDF